jgi:small subunit ribosomal protein S6
MRPFVGPHMCGPTGGACTAWTAATVASILRTATLCDRTRMTLPAPTYDLMLLLDPQAEDGARAKIVADTRAAIEAQGELLRYDPWGERPLAYPIEKKTSADYYLMQFHVGDVELLSSLNRTLLITDGVVRFRIIKLAPGVPDAPNMRSSAASAERESPETGQPQQTPAEVAGEPELAVADSA